MEDKYILITRFVDGGIMTIGSNDEDKLLMVADMIEHEWECYSDSQPDKIVLTEKIEVLYEKE